MVGVSEFKGGTAEPKRSDERPADGSGHIEGGIRECRPRWKESNSSTLLNAQNFSQRYVDSLKKARPKQRWKTSIGSVHAFLQQTVLCTRELRLL